MEEGAPTHGVGGGTEKRGPRLAVRNQGYGWERKQPKDEHVLTYQSSREPLSSPSLGVKVQRSI